MPASLDIINCFFEKHMSSIFVPKESLKFNRVLANPILACIIPNLRPIHTLGPLKWDDWVNYNYLGINEHTFTKRKPSIRMSFWLFFWQKSIRIELCRIRIDFRIIMYCVNGYENCTSLRNELRFVTICNPVVLGRSSSERSQWWIFSKRFYNDQINVYQRE